MKIDKMLFTVYSCEELSLLLNLPLKLLREYRADLCIPYQKFRTGEQFGNRHSDGALTALKYNLINSTPKMLNMDSSIEYIARMFNMAHKKLPWGYHTNYQQYIRSRKYKVVKIQKVHYENICYLESLNLHMHYSNPMHGKPKFYITHYKLLNILKTAEIPIDIATEILQSRDVEYTLMKHSKFIRQSFFTTPVATKQDFIPIPSRKLFDADLSDFYTP